MRWVVVLTSGFRELPAVAQGLGPLVEISRPNIVGTCNTGFNPFGYTYSTDHATEPFVAASPNNPRNVAAAWFQGLFQDMTAGASFRHDHDKEQIRPERGLVYFPILRSLIRGREWPRQMMFSIVI